MVNPKRVAREKTPIGRKKVVKATTLRTLTCSTKTWNRLLTVCIGDHQNRDTSARFQQTTTMGSTMD